MIAIVDYGMGNLASVQKALNFLKLDNIITNDEIVIRNATSIILPGVGSFRTAMENLSRLNLISVLEDEVLIKKKKFLGICLGMQLLASLGTEQGSSKGLGWIDGKVIRIHAEGKRVPHLGWNEIHFKRNGMFNNMIDKNFYFIHSYHFVPDNPDNIFSTFNYGCEMVAGVIKDNILAFQFHPEKSQNAGLFLLKEYFNSEHA